MSYCINPKCQNRENPDSAQACQSCGTPLEIENRYRIIRPLRPLNPVYPTDIYEVKDWGNGDEDWGTIKVMKVLKFSNNPNFIRLFKREARVLMWLRHRGIPHVEPDGYFQLTLPRNKHIHCLVMEKIDGENLEEWLEQSDPICETEALDWLQQLTEILDTLHQESLFHRDIKPSNIILRPNGQLALIDFGTVGEEESNFTRVGTSGYAAPEQIIGDTKPQSDFFALGRTFVHLLTGLSPMDFPETNNEELLWRNLAPQISPMLADFIDRLMAPAYEKRPSNTRAIFRELKQIESVRNAKQSKPELTGFWKRRIPLKWVGFLLIGFIGFGILSHPVAIFVKDWVAIPLAKSANHMGTFEFKRGQFGSAEFYLKLAVQLHPESGKALYNLGMVCEEREKLPCAREQYEEAISNGDRIDAAVQAINNLGRLWIFRDGNYDKAIAKLQYGLERANHAPNLKPVAWSDLHKNLGWAYYEQKRYRESEKHLRQAIEYDPKNAPAYCLLAQVLEAQDNRTLALEYWKQCQALEAPYNPEIQYWKKMARDRLGK
ncbi:serine/threonine-protein kinase [Phormidium sp. CCY1219]|uniref:serine/threonine-protein kinase n=1 Tax=Phormidium sp. CCY1219 TaxID=2886104 RepID=UPI002D1EC603|nr:serine/threonine-protein kinase [Phormidium sp. CCY1219]MEB3827109.1 serine/threonine-protein kinase [Phormidium sp. CCY1219]